MFVILILYLRTCDVDAYIGSYITFRSTAHGNCRRNVSPLNRIMQLLIDKSEQFCSYWNYRIDFVLMAIELLWNLAACYPILCCPRDSFLGRIRRRPLPSLELYWTGTCGPSSHHLTWQLLGFLWLWSRPDNNCSIISSVDSKVSTPNTPSLAIYNVSQALQQFVNGN